MLQKNVQVNRKILATPTVHDELLYCLKFVRQNKSNPLPWCIKTKYKLLCLLYIKNLIKWLPCA